MINIMEYKHYNGEKNIALLDNSTIEFLMNIEHYNEECVLYILKDYDAIFIPNWVLEEVKDSNYRKKFVEKLARKLLIYKIDEIMYSELMDGKELLLYEIVKASVANISDMLAYLRRNVEKANLMDMDEYEEWIEKLSKVFRNVIPVSVGFKSNDFIMAQLYGNNIISEQNILDIRKDSRTVTYIRKCEDQSNVLEKRKLDNYEFVKLIKESKVEIIF